jgi:hypothetical protein
VSDHTQRPRQVSEWFAAKGVNPTCSQCGSESFEELPVDRKGRPQPWVSLVTSIYHRTDGTIATRVRAYPLMCTNCGHFVLFSADKMGLQYQRR